MPRLRARIDNNQPTIVKAFRRMGCEVFATHQIGKGFPDLVVAVSERVLLVEVKDGDKPPSARKLTDDEQAFAYRFPVEIVESVEDVAALVNRIRKAA